MVKKLIRCVALVALTAAGVQACSQSPGGSPRPGAPEMLDISAGCLGNNSEVEEATAGDGTVYVSYMHADGVAGRPGTSMYPVVAASRDHGASFARTHSLFPPKPGNWGDRDFLAAGPAGPLYLTWDYGPAGPEVKLLCARSGSCAYANGDFNAVIQTSADGGRTWSAPVRVTPDTAQAPHITESASGQAGIAYVAWQTSAPAPGYATYLRPFSIRHGWLGPAVKVSAKYGNAAVWPGDTFGIARLPDGRISLTWGSAVGASKKSAIYAAVVTS